MRKLIVFSILALAFTACSNVGQYKEAIEGLSSNWEETTTKVSGVVDQISQAQEMAKSALASMSPSEEIVAQMSEEQTSTLNGIKESVQAQMGGLGELSKTAFEFVNKWQAEGETLKGLTDGLSNGKLPKDVQTTIDGLKGIVDEANTNVEGWNGQLGSAKEAVGAAVQAYTDLMGSFQMEG
ncbi:MAG: hypothetical protein MI974_30650 [Chitinophagales bacterium]|nr:hypothetical protein [Chitinophagales bacterium]